MILSSVRPPLPPPTPTRSFCPRRRLADARPPVARIGCVVGERVDHFIGARARQSVEFGRKQVASKSNLELRTSRRPTLPSDQPPRDALHHSSSTTRVQFRCIQPSGSRNNAVGSRVLTQVLALPSQSRHRRPTIRARDPVKFSTPPLAPDHSAAHARPLRKTRLAPM